MNFIRKIILVVFKPGLKNCLSTELKDITKRAAEFGLAEKDIVYVEEFISHREYGLALSHVTQQLYEYSIPIDAGFYRSVVECCEYMDISKAEFVFLKALIR